MLTTGLTHAGRARAAVLGRSRQRLYAYREHFVFGAAGDEAGRRGEEHIDVILGQMERSASRSVARPITAGHMTGADNGPTVHETDANVYTLVLQSGAWKVQADQHPNTRTLQPQPGTPGIAPTSAVPTPIASVASPGTGVGQSSNWAGYSTTGGTFTAVSATWTVPNVSAGSGNSVASDATWVGIGGVNTTDLL